MAFYKFSISSILVALVALQQPCLLKQLDETLFIALCEEASAFADAKDCSISLEELQTFLKNKKIALQPTQELQSIGFSSDSKDFSYPCRLLSSERSPFAIPDVAGFTLFSLKKKIQASRAAISPQDYSGFSLPLRI